MIIQIFVGNVEFFNICQIEGTMNFKMCNIVNCILYESNIDFERGEMNFNL